MATPKANQRGGLQGKSGAGSGRGAAAQKGGASKTASKGATSAQKGGGSSRGNAGGATRGSERADEVRKRNVGNTDAEEQRTVNPEEQDQELENQNIGEDNDNVDDSDEVDNDDLDNNDFNEDDLDEDDDTTSEQTGAGVVSAQDSTASGVGGTVTTGDLSADANPEEDVTFADDDEFDEAPKMGVTGQGAVPAVVNDFEAPTRSQIVAEEGITDNAHLHKQRQKVPQPVSTPLNTNNGASPYGAPKEDYGGSQAQSEGVYMGDVVSTKANTNLASPVGSEQQRAQARRDQEQQD